MNSSKLKGYLENATNVAVLLVALVFLAGAAQKYLLRDSARIRTTEGLTTGRALPPIPNINFADSPKTVVIAMSTRCRYCTESLPFYKEVVEAQRMQFPGTRVVAVFPEPAEDVRRYMQQSQLDIKSIPAVDLEALNISGTPTMMFVDGAGKVINFWSGKLTKEAERQILKEMS